MYSCLHDDGVDAFSTRSQGLHQLMTSGHQTVKRLQFFVHDFFLKDLASSRLRILASCSSWTSSATEHSLNCVRDAFQLTFGCPADINFIDSVCFA